MLFGLPLELTEGGEVRGSFLNINLFDEATKIVSNLSFIQSYHSVCNFSIGSLAWGLDELQESWYSGVPPTFQNSDPI